METPSATAAPSRCQYQYPTSQKRVSKNSKRCNHWRQQELLPARGQSWCKFRVGVNPLKDTIAWLRWRESLRPWGRIVGPRQQFPSSRNECRRQIVEGARANGCRKIAIYWILVLHNCGRPSCHPQASCGPAPSPNQGAISRHSPYEKPIRFLLFSRCETVNQIRSFSELRLSTFSPCRPAFNFSCDGSKCMVEVHENSDKPTHDSIFHPDRRGPLPACAGRLSETEDAPKRSRCRFGEPSTQPREAGGRRDKPRVANSKAWSVTPIFRWSRRTNPPSNRLNLWLVWHLTRCEVTLAAFGTTLGWRRKSAMVTDLYQLSKSPSSGVVTSPKRAEVSE